MTSTFEVLRQFLYERSGLSLEGDKLYLVESRLLPIAREFGLADLPSLLKRLQTGDRDLAQAVVEAMTTNETFFFRDRVPFDKFRSVILPELLAARAAERRLRIWCAACSTGQEPYSLAMLLDEEARRFTGWSVEILATDLSRRAIETARQGLYSQFEVQRGLSAHRLVRHFENAEDGFALSPQVRAMVRWQRVNLVEDVSRMGRFDLILCRGLAPALTEAARERVLANLAGALADGGYLALGPGETAPGLAPAPGLSGFLCRAEGERAAA